MKDQDKTKQQLVTENEELRRRVAVMEGVEAELRRSEAKWRSVAENAPLFMAVVDRNGRLEFLNRTQPGFTMEQVIGRDVCDFLQTEYHEGARKCLAQVFQTGETISYQSIGSGPAGSSSWYETHIGPVAVDDEIIAATLISRDITERKQAEEALRKANDELERRVEERTADLSVANDQLRIFRMFAEASGQGFGMADLDGYITYWNPTLCRFFGEDTPENIVGKHVSAYYPKEYVERRQNEILPTVMRGGNWQGEVLIYSRQGKATPVLQNTFLVRDDKGNPVRLAAAITDITKLKLAESALQTSEQKYRTLVETSPDGVIMADLKGHITYASGPVLEYTGAERVEDLLGRNPLDFIVNADHHRFLDNLRRTVEAGFTRGIEYECLRKDGAHFPVEISAAVIKDVSGKPSALVAIVRDITERKRAEQALRESEERYELAIRGAGVGIWDWDVRTGKLYFSPRWKMLFGYDESDIGNSVEEWARLLHPDERDWMLKFLEDFLAGKSPTVTVEYRLRHKEGSYRWIMAHAVVVRDDQGKAIRLVGSHGDITDRKQAEEALRQSHDELRAIYESLGDGLLVADRETLRLVRANAAICSMLGYSEEELLSMSIPDLHPKETLSSIVDPIQTGMVRHLPGKGNVPMLRKDGSVFYADITGDTFTYQGRPCSLGVFRDVTERRQAQAALEREHRTLEHMLRASDHERQLIAYDIHDGLAQYLTGAIMHLQMSEHLREQSTGESVKAFEGGMALLRQGHSEARRLISGVRPPILDESGVMAAISHLIHDPAFEQGPKIEFRSKVTFSRLNPVVENVIYRIVQEGLSNARNHSKSQKIVVSLVQRGEQLRIEIRDWGVGFDPKNVQENRFGLDGIRERARLLGGKCNIKSGLGEGTTVVVELPVAEHRQVE